ncbi:MFS general substrate transporter [Lentinus brumalis]|uniref:MFS general substrate transporter n=1 Tax=Lentinus brumalis TaxID=2498619 RepID=A0A371CTS7_9APHY|nr:MFS general substrate transporter [Polyporus brumalis]
MFTEGVTPIEMLSIKRSGGSIEERSTESPREYRLYKRRWIGLLALVILNIVSGMVLVWFGPIANNVVADFGFTLDQVNWFGNVVNVVYLPSAVVVPYLYGRLGLRGTGYIGAFLFIVSGWVRYAGTARSLSKSDSLALIMIGQLLAGLTVPIFQVIIPSYSERWFDLKGRTTATMIMGLSNPVGNALGQLIPPLIGTTRQSLLVMAIIFTVAAPVVFLVGDHPPTPPTFAASHKHPSMMSLVHAMLGRLPRDQYTYMTVRQRLDFAIMVLVFGVLVGIINSFTILTAQQLGPYGYSDDTAGFMGAALLLVGLVAAAVTAPLYDRVFTHHLALSCKLLTPIMAACWIALIWEIKPNNDVVLYVLMALIGGTSLSLLPVVLELAVELTRNADGSSAILWLSTNLFGLIFVLVEGALRAGPDANPPLNMRRAFIFQASVISASVLLIHLVEGKQTRRAQDELKRDQAERATHQHVGIEVVEVPSERDDKRSSREIVPPSHMEKGGSTLSIPGLDSPVGAAGPDAGGLRAS